MKDMEPEFGEEVEKEMKKVKKKIKFWKMKK